MGRPRAVSGAAPSPPCTKPACTAPTHTTLMSLVDLELGKGAVMASGRVICGCAEPPQNRLILGARVDLTRTPQQSPTYVRGHVWTGEIAAQAMVAGCGGVDTALAPRERWSGGVKWFHVKHACATPTADLIKRRR